MVIVKENEGWNKPQKKNLNFGKWSLIPRTIQKDKKKD
jgi:hypothetical protein